MVTTILPDQGHRLKMCANYGTSSTILAQAADLHVCATGPSVLFMTLTTWLENVALARASGTYLRYRDKIAKPALVIIDDFGMR